MDVGGIYDWFRAYHPPVVLIFLFEIWSLGGALCVGECLQEEL